MRRNTIDHSTIGATKEDEASWRTNTGNHIAEKVAFLC